MKYITIGEIINVRGIKGEIKVRPITSDIARYSKLKLVYIDGKPYKIIGNYIEKGYVYLSFFDVRTRSDAEAFKGKFITISEVNAVDLEEGEYFIADLIGMQVVFQSGEKLGYIENIDQFGAADVFTVDMKNGKRVRFPFLNRIVAKINSEERQFVVIKEKFDEVAVYED